jgi:hypothetical protein
MNFGTSPATGGRGKRVTEKSEDLPDSDAGGKRDHTCCAADGSDVFQIRQGIQRKNTAGLVSVMAVRIRNTDVFKMCSIATRFPQ